MLLSSLDLSEAVLPSLDLCNVVSLSRPVDRAVLLRVQFLPQGEDERRFLALEPLSVEVAHRNVDCTRVDPPSVRMDGKPFGKEPKLWRDWILAIPIIHIEHRKPKLAP